MLDARGHSQEDVLRLFQFIDSVMTLPEGLEQLYWEEVEALLQ